MYIFEVLLSIAMAVCFMLLIPGIEDAISAKAARIQLKGSLVLVVKDQEDAVEGIVRTIMEREGLTRIIPGGRLKVVDLGSRDQTVDILERLKDEYEIIDIVGENEKEKIFITN